MLGLAVQCMCETGLCSISLVYSCDFGLDAMSNKYKKVDKFKLFLATVIFLVCVICTYTGPGQFLGGSILPPFVTNSSTSWLLRLGYGM